MAKKITVVVVLSDRDAEDIRPADLSDIFYGIDDGTILPVVDPSITIEDSDSEL